jgi:hypothetical protein
LLAISKMLKDTFTKRPVASTYQNIESAAQSRGGLQRK